MGKIRDLTGQKFGFLEVVEFAGLDDQKTALWNCKCVCGKEVVAQSSPLVRGRRRSCGCMAKNGTGDGVDAAPIQMVECKQCGEKFPNVTRAHNRRVCDKCRYENKKASLKAQYGISPFHSEDEAKSFTKPHFDGMRFEEIVRAAKARGLAYGEFMLEVEKTGELPGIEKAELLAKLPKLPEEYDRWALNHPDVRKCKKCIYRAYIASGSTTGSVYGCQYILITGKKRPCKPGKDCTEFIKRGKAAEDEYD